MHKLKTIHIEGFRGQKTPIRLDLRDDANFIIGRNGTGKTTLINLINGALAADAQALREVQFDSIELTFKAAGQRATPKVRITKEFDEPIEQITYSVQDSARSEPNDYSILRPMRRRISNDLRRGVVSIVSSRKELQERLKHIYRAAWLSLQRHTASQDPEDFEFEVGGSDVDKKLDQVLNDLVKYFSRLDRSVTEQTQAFQKQWFLSSLASDRRVSFTAVRKLDLEGERKALTSIFDNFNMDPAMYRPQL